MQKKKFRVTGTLNRDDPKNLVEEDEIEELEEIEEMGVGRWQIQEVKEALRKTKPGKAVGVDEVGSDLLRADMEYTTSIGFGKLKGGRRCGRRD